MAESRTKAPVATTAPRLIELPRALTVKDLAEAIKTSPVDIIKELMKNGVMASMNQVIDYDTAAVVTTDLGFETQEAAPPEPQQPLRQVRRTETEEEGLIPRPPVVTIMGHVDH